MSKPATSGSAGHDLRCIEPAVLARGSITKVTVQGVPMQPDLWVKIESRSSLAAQGVMVLGGVIDSDYTGPWIVILLNVGNCDIRLEAGSRVAQAVFHKLIQPHGNTGDSRGDRGFGSTGA